MNGSKVLTMVAVCAAIAFAAVLGSDAAANPFRAADYAPLRRTLRAFYPDESNCRGTCKDAAVVASVRRIGEELDAWAAAHPGFDALDLRRECYLSIRRNFRPVLFPSLPFYCEAGANGGWYDYATAVPGRHVSRITSRFYKEKGLIPDAAFETFLARCRERLMLCCGPFSDDMHHVPPYHTVFTKGFGGVRAEVAAALAACPADDPSGRKELETALVGLDTLHEMQLKFAEEARRLLLQ